MKIGNNTMYNGGNIGQFYNDYQTDIEGGKKDAKDNADLYFKAREVEALERIAFVLEWYMQRTDYADSKADLYL